MTNLDEIRRLTIQLVVMTEYRELLYAAAVAGFERPVLVERGVRLVQSRKDAPAVPDDLSVMDEGSLRVDLDRFTFTGSRYTRTAAARHISSVREDVDGGQVYVHPSGDRPWHLDGVSPVGVFAAATACRMTAEDSRRYRSNPAKVAAELLDPQDPTLPIPGDGLVLETRGAVQGVGRVGSWPAGANPSTLNPRTAPPAHPGDGTRADDAGLEAPVRLAPTTGKLSPRPAFASLPKATSAMSAIRIPRMKNMVPPPRSRPSVGHPEGALCKIRERGGGEDA